MKRKCPPTRPISPVIKQELIDLSFFGHIYIRNILGVYRPFVPDCASTIVKKKEVERVGKERWDIYLSGMSLFLLR